MWMRRWIGPVALAGVACAALLMPMRASLAWGPDGHRVIALVADRVLQQSDPAVRAKVQAVLATDKGSAADRGSRLTKNDIASEATWADVLRDKSPEARLGTTPWHTTRLKPDRPDLAAACFGRKPLPSGYPASRGPRDNCSVDKIAQFIAELKNPETTSFQRLAALQFVLNLVGDVNDPLNAIDRGDQGGECIALQIGAKPPVRLSTYWEEILVRQVIGADAASGAGRLMAGLPAEAQKWAAGNAEAWAYESHEIAKTATYSFAAEQPVGNHVFPAKKGQESACPSAPLYRVGADYETKAQAAVRTQLAKAGLRLAAVLRDSFK
jgi:hypothetical protein